MDMVKRFPQYLNSPLQMAFWEADVVAVAIISLYTGFFLKGPFYSIIVLMPYFYNRLKKNYPRGFIRHIFYFIGITSFKGYPSFFEKRFFE